MNEICEKILGSPKSQTPLIGVDCEGFSLKHKSIAMIQVSYNQHSYLFDLKVINPFDVNHLPNVATLLQSTRIVKIFHDCCEDIAALLNQHGVMCNKIFDTQIAHRIKTQATM